MIKTYLKKVECPNLMVNSVKAMTVNQVHEKDVGNVTEHNLYGGFSEVERLFKINVFSLYGQFCLKYYLAISCNNVILVSVISVISLFSPVLYCITFSCHHEQYQII